MTSANGKLEAPWSIGDPVPDADGDLARRAYLLAGLRVLNGELSRHGRAPLISLEAAELYPTGDLPTLIGATRVELTSVVRAMAGLG